MPRACAPPRPQALPCRALLLLISLSLLISPAASVLSVQFLHLFPAAPHPLTVYWVAEGGMPYSCTANYTQACGITYPIPLGTQFSVLINSAPNEQLTNATETYTTESIGLTWVLLAPHNSSDPYLVRVANEQAFPANSTLAYGIVVNGLAAPLASVVDVDHSNAIFAQDVAPLSAATARFPFGNATFDRTAWTVEGLGRLGFSGLDAIYNSTAMGVIFASGPLAGVSLLLYVPDAAITRIALPAVLPPLPKPPRHSNWPVAVIVIAAILGFSGAVALISCLVTWVQDVRHVASKAEGYEPI